MLGRRSPLDSRLFLAYPHDSGALSQSVDKLQLFDDGGSDLVSVTHPQHRSHDFSRVLVFQFSVTHWN